MNALWRFALIVALSTALGCSDWTAFRGDALRTGYQPDAGAFSDPGKVQSLSPTPRWTFHPTGAIAFRASPIVYSYKVLLGNGNGFFYAVDAQKGTQIWQYPAAPPALTSQFVCNPSSLGIASSATLGLGGKLGITPIVVFAAPDQSVGTHLGEGRLFALNANSGTEIWKSPVLSHITGLTPYSTTEQHEQLGYSSPLLADNGVLYVGVANHCDNPIQRGRIAAVDFSNGAIHGGFSFSNGLRPGNTSPPGGDIWGSLAEYNGALYTTTGNTRSGTEAEPSPDFGLSLLRIDPSSGAVQWQHQPVPYSLDADPDWSATPTVVKSSCGDLVISTQKDGWTWAVDAGPSKGSHPSVRWVFPADNPSWINGFTNGDGTTHGDTDYNRPGASWGDVYVTMDGGEDTVDNINIGFSHLHALNVCADDAHRIRWIATLPGSYPGPPVVTHGIVYVGTDSGHLLALADPTVAAPSGWVCAKVTVSNAQCAANGFSLVPQPKTLFDIQLDGAIRTEPVLAEKNLYVATDNGTLYMFDP